MRAAAIALGAVFLLSLPTWAQFQVPRLTGPVVDEVGLLNPEDRRDLERVLRQVNAEGRAQIQVVILHSLGGLEIEQAAIRIFDQWKLGSAKADNGALFLISTGEKRMRFEVGRGLEGVIPDVIAKRILSDQVTPLFRAGRPSTGVLVGVNEILLRLQGETGTEAGVAGGEASDKATEKWIFLAIFFVFIIVQVLRVMSGGGRRVYGRGGLSPWGGAIGGGLLGGGFGGGGGGGGWGGGGGSSAGGGASGGW